MKCCLFYRRYCNAAKPKITWLFTVFRLLVILSICLPLLAEHTDFNIVLHFEIQWKIGNACGIRNAYIHSKYTQKQIDSLNKRTNVRTNRTVYTFPQKTIKEMQFEFGFSLQKQLWIIYWHRFNQLTKALRCIRCACHESHNRIYISFTESNLSAY